MDPSSVSVAASHLLAGKYFQLAAFVMLVYDHMLTFSQEVDRIWRHRFSAATLLFFINRYCTLMQFIIILTAFHAPSWVGEVCRRFVLFEGTTTVGLIAVGQLVMILRVYAIYDRNNRILFLLLVLWAAQIVISAVGLRTGYPVPLPPGLVGCILTGRGTLFPSVWISPLITDSVIFLLTIYRTKLYLNHLLSPFMSETAARAIMILVRDGTMYFFFIFLANLMNTLIFFLAPADLKAIGASFSQLLTCTILSRLVLNLRSISMEQNYTTMDQGDDRIVFQNPSYVERERARLSLVGKGATSSLWTKALESLADDTLSGGPGGPRAVRGIHVTTEVIYGDVPLQRLEQGSRASGKPYPLA